MSMPLNDEGVCCERRSVATVVGEKKVGRKIVPDIQNVLKLVPAKDWGWKEVLVYEKPYLLGNGRIELRQLTYDRDNFRCIKCKTTKYTLLKLIGHEYNVRRAKGFIYGTGVQSHCFKCDTGGGPIGEEEYPEVKVLEESISRKRAKEIIKKYGLHAPRIMRLKG